jgi:plastocyanin
MKSSFKNRLKSLLAASSAILVCFGCPVSIFGATATVLVGSGGLVFTPATTNISVNDRVIWTWAGTFHSTTSGTVVGSTATPNGLWDSGVVTSLPHSFTNTFASAGSFPYYCSIHFSAGMRGTILVTAPNLPPTVAITNLVSGTVFAAPANVTIQASAADTDGTVTNVQFLVGSTVLTNETAAPFSAITNNLAAGSYTLSAIASDNLGATTTNSINILVDAPPSVTITNPASGTVLSEPANVTIQASAMDTDGTVTNVQFLVGSTVLTNETAAPFFALTNNLAAGSYTFFAVATDNAGLTATNAVTISIVTPMQVALGAPTQLSSTNFQFSYSADVGLTYVIQLSTDLTSPDWIGISTNIATSNPMIFMDSNATNNPGFYRVELLPNP